MGSAGGEGGLQDAPPVEQVLDELGVVDLPARDICTCSNIWSWRTRRGWLGEGVAEGGYSFHAMLPSFACVFFRHRIVFVTPVAAGVLLLPLTCAAQNGVSCRFSGFGPRLSHSL